MLEVNQRIVKIPVSSRLNPVDREQAQMISQYVATPEDAKKLVMSSQEWSIRQLDGNGKAFVLKYRGCDIRLIYMRQMLDEVLDAGIPVPDVAIETRTQEWLSWNLVDDAEKVVERQQNLSDSSSAVQSRDLAYKQMADVRVQYEREKADYADEILKWKTLAEKAVDKLDEAEKQVAAAQTEVRSVRARAFKQVTDAKAEGIRTAVAELIPIINVLDQQKDKVEWALLCVSNATKHLESLGLEVIVPRAGDKFDPNVHHAVEVLEMESEHVGKIIERVSIGVKQGQVIIKAADVVVAKEKSQEVTT